MRYSYSAVHGESKTVWACGDGNSPQALTFDSADRAKRVVSEANSADYFQKVNGFLPYLLSEDAFQLIEECGQ